jgi:hypothetical protein
MDTVLTRFIGLWKAQSTRKTLTGNETLLLKLGPQLELPNWPKLAEYAASLVPKKTVSTGAGKSGHGGETQNATRSAAGVEVTQPAAVEEEEGSPAPVGEAEAEPPSDSEPPEQTASGKAE